MGLMSRILVVFSVSVLLVACEKLLFSDNVGCDDCDSGVPVENTGGRLTRPSAEAPWVPLIDACMAEGRTRADCIDSLPPEVMAQLETWEAENARIRRELLKRRQ